MSDEKRQDYPNILSRLDNLDYSVKEIKKMLIGNGNVGALEQLRNNTIYIDNQRRLGIVIIKSLIGSVIVILVGFLAYKLGIMYQ